MHHPLPRVWSFGYHTVTFWSFARETCELRQARVMKDWPFSHSPSEAVSPIEEIGLSEVQPDWLHADQPHELAQ